MISMNFSNVQKRSALPDGDYEMVIDSVEQKVSSTGKDMLVVVYKHEESGTKIWDNYVLTENCMWKLAQLMDAVGVQEEGEFEMDENDLVGQSILVRVATEEYNGQERNRAVRVMPL